MIIPQVPISKMWLFNDMTWCTQFIWGQGVTIVIVNVWDVLQLCHFITDTSDVNTFRQKWHLSETTTGKLCDFTWHVSTWDNRQVILERLHFEFGISIFADVVRLFRSFGSHMIWPKTALGQSDGWFSLYFTFLKCRGAVSEFSETYRWKNLSTLYMGYNYVHM